MKKVVLLKLLLVFAMAGQLWAQTRTVTGRVTGPEGSPLPGVTVVEKGTTNGVTTTSEGNFSLTVQPNATLVVSFIGMSNQEVILGNRSMINVQLKEDSQKLSEVVVTAFGIEAEKRTLGYSAQNVNPAQLQQSREPNIVNALAGKVAGVQINNSGGQAGSSSRIVIRGNTSLTGENQPLFVVDGIPIDNSTNRGINAATEGALFNGYGGNRAIDLDPTLLRT
jgi:outer membrane receptor protein involved in Fe transport